MSKLFERNEMVAEAVKHEGPMHIQKIRELGAELATARRERDAWKSEAMKLREALVKYSYEISHGFSARESIEQFDKFVESKK